MGPGRPGPQLTRRSSARERLRMCHWPGHPFLSFAIAGSSKRWPVNSLFPRIDVSPPLFLLTPLGRPVTLFFLHIVDLVLESLDRAERSATISIPHRQRGLRRWRLPAAALQADSGPNGSICDVTWCLAPYVERHRHASFLKGRWLLILLRRVVAAVSPARGGEDW